MSDSLLDDLSPLYSAVLSDVMDEMGYTRQSLSAAVRPFSASDKVVGRVYTMKADSVATVPKEPYKLQMEAIDTAQPGDVLLLEGGHNPTCAIWGELLSTACMAKGIRGIVMTACTRDIWALRQLEFPVFAIGTASADSKGRLNVIEIREPILIDGVTARHGDYLIGDSDGVVIIPQDIAAEVIAAAKEKVSGENTVRDELAAGDPVNEVFSRHGIL